MFNIDEHSSKILIVDDNPVNIDFLVELLKDYDARTVLDGPSALEAVEEERPDLILLDISMPGMDGFEVCKRLKQNAKFKEIPIIFLSASADDESIVHGFEIGGADYITKPYKTKEVLIRIQTQLQLKHAIEKLENLTMFDELTGLPNRKQFFEASRPWISQSQKTQEPFQLFIFSLRAFTEINDKYGFAVGDQIIKAIPTIVRKVIKSECTLARFGGVEFFLAFTMMSRDEALKEMEKVVQGAAAAKFKAMPELEIRIKYGHAEYQSDDKTINTMIRRAHQDLYTK